MRRSLSKWPGVAILAALTFTFLPGPLRAQETGRIVGRVTAAATMRPLTGAQVFVANLRIGALTNEDGRFLILNVPPGTHPLRVEIIGFENATQEVTVTAGGTAQADFSLAETAVSLEEIVVTGTAAEVRAREVGNALDAVTSRQLEHIPVTNRKTSSPDGFPV